MTTSRPSLAELRTVAQAGVLERRSAEHWAGRWYMRRVSLRVTRWLVGTRVTPNALTLLMIVVGLVAAALAALPGIWTALAVVAGIQVYLLLDCVDGEVARWQRRTSAAGIYLDRLGHHVVEAALVIALGVRAAGGPSIEASWWVVAGAIGALLVVLGKLATDLIVVARAGAGLVTSDEADPRSRVPAVRGLRRLIGYLPVHRLVGAVELSLALVVAAVVDQVSAGLAGSRALVLLVAGIAAIVAIGHPLTVLTSQRLR